MPDTVNNNLGDTIVTDCTAGTSTDSDGIYFTGTSSNINIATNGGYYIGTQFTGTSAVTNTFTIPSWTTTSTFDPLQQQVNEMQRVLNEIVAERELRKKYPALDYAYEQYEVMLEICKLKEADDAAGENSQGS